MSTNNRGFAESDQNFRTACERANIKPTKRQASKFLNKKGSAFKMWLRMKQNVEAN